MAQYRGKHRVARQVLEKHFARGLVDSSKLLFNALLPHWTHVRSDVWRRIGARKSCASLKGAVLQLDSPGHGGNGNGGSYEDIVYATMLCIVRVSSCVGQRIVEHKPPISELTLGRFVRECIELHRTPDWLHKHLTSWLPRLVMDSLKPKMLEAREEPEHPFLLSEGGAKAVPCARTEFDQLIRKCRSGRLDLVVIDPELAVWVRGKRFAPSHLTFELLSLMAKEKPGTVFTYSSIIKRVWNEEWEKLLPEPAIDRILRVIRQNITPMFRRAQEKQRRIVHVQRGTGVYLDDRLAVAIITKPTSQYLDIS